MGFCWSEVLYLKGYAPTPIKGKPSIFVCPSWPAYPGHPDGAWVGIGFTYGINIQYGRQKFKLDSNPVYGMSIEWSRAGERVPSWKAKSPAEFVLLADTNCAYGVGEFLGEPQGWQWYEIETGSLNYNRAVHVRHAKRANCLFLDGHVESLTKQELISNHGLRETAVFE